MSSANITKANSSLPAKSWTYRRLCDIALVTMGNSPPGASYNEKGDGVPLINGPVEFGTGPFGVTSRSKFTTQPTKMCQAGDFLICVRGSTTGRTNIAGFDACIGRGVASIRAKCHQKYLNHYIRTLERKIHASGNGSTFPSISQQQLNNLLIPIPYHTSDQERIAEILDEAEALRAKRKAALALLDELTQSIFLDMFAHDNFQSYEMVTVSDLIDKSKGGIRTGPFGSQLLHREFKSEGIAVLGIDNAVQNEFAWKERRFISEAKYRQLRRYTVYPGDVLITIMGTCGKCAIVPDDLPTAINTKHLCCITLDQTKCLPQFLHAYFLRHPVAIGYLRDRAKGAIMSGLNMTIIKEMPVPLFSIERQTTFAMRIKGIAIAKERLLYSERKFNSLFASLQYRGFEGVL